MVISYGLDTHIYSLDIDTDLCDNRAKVASSVTFVQGDSNKIEEAFTPTSLQVDCIQWLIPHIIVHGGNTLTSHL